MANRLEIDFLDPVLQRHIAEATGTSARYVWRALPKRAAVYYAGLIVGVVLWLAPLGTKRHPGIKLATLVAAAATVAVSQDALEDYQDELDDQRHQRNVKRSYQLTNTETIAGSHYYSVATQARLASNARLPAHLIEPDLLDVKVQSVGDAQSDPEFAAWARAADAMRAGVDSSEMTGRASARSTAQLPLKFGWRKVTGTNEKERIVELTGHTSYGGLPIVDLAREIALDKRGALVVAPTGCGKSELQKRIICHQHQFISTTDFTVFAHKGPNKAIGETLDFAGLENTKDVFVLTETQSGSALLSAANDMRDRLLVIRELLANGSKDPCVLVIDQTNQGLRACQNAQTAALRLDAESPWSDLSDLKNEYSATIKTGLLDGRTLRVKVWSFSHSNTCDALGIDHQEKTNVPYSGLGRLNNYSAVAQPLKVKDYIPSPKQRKVLLQQLTEYLEAHQAHGSPVNVVIALTCAGQDGWRLIVLPQLTDQVGPVDLSAVNPHVDDRDGDGLPDPNQSPSNTLGQRAESLQTADTPEDKSVNVQAARKALEQTLGLDYTAGQKQAATEFVRWIKANARDYVNSLGLIDPHEVWPVFPGCASNEELEVLLNLIVELGGGAYEQHPTTGDLMFRLVGFRSQRDRYGITGTLLTSEQVVWDESMTAGVNPQSAQPDLNPGGVSDEVFLAVIEQLMKAAQGSIHTPSGFIDGSNRLKKVIKLKVFVLREILSFLHQKGCVDFPNQTASDFQILGFNSYL